VRDYPITLDKLLERMRAWAEKGAVALGGRSHAGGCAPPYVLGVIAATTTRLLISVRLSPCFTRGSC